MRRQNNNEKTKNMRTICTNHTWHSYSFEGKRHAEYSRTHNLQLNQRSRQTVDSSITISNLYFYFRSFVRSFVQLRMLFTIAHSHIRFSTQINNHSHTHYLMSYCVATAPGWTLFLFSVWKIREHTMNATIYFKNCFHLLRVSISLANYFLLSFSIGFNAYESRESTSHWTLQIFFFFFCEAEVCHHTLVDCISRPCRSTATKISVCNELDENPMQIVY